MIGKDMFKNGLAKMAIMFVLGLLVIPGIFVMAGYESWYKEHHIFIHIPLGLAFLTWASMDPR